MESASIHFSALLLVSVLAVSVPLVFARFRRLTMPVVVGEILAGIVFGRSGLGWIPTDDIALNILAEIGLAFLFFLAGMEVDLGLLGLRFSEDVRRQTRRRQGPSPLLLAAGHFALTLLLSGGFAWAVRHAFARTVSPGFLVFLLSTSSLDVAMTVLKERGLLGSYYGQTLFFTALLADFLAVLGITVFVAFHTRGWTPEVLLVTVLFIVVLALYRIGISLQSSLQRFLESISHTTARVKVRLAVVLFVAFVALAETLGIEVILGAFLAGMLITMLAPEEEEIRYQLESFGFGFFVPVFFIMVGAEFNAAVLWQGDGQRWWLWLAVLGVAFANKLLPAALFRVVVPWRASVAGGFLLASRLSLVIAAAEIGVRVGLLPEDLMVAMVLIALTTIILGPAVFNRLYPEAPDTQPRHIILVGAGPLAHRVAALLARYHVPLCIATHDPEHARHSQEMGLPVHVVSPETATWPPCFARAEQALLILDQPKDLEQWAIALHNHFPHLHIVALSPTPEPLTKLRTLGIRILFPQDVQAQFLALMARNPDFTRLLTAPHPGETLANVEIRHPGLHGRPLREIRFPPSVLVLTVYRNGEYLIPKGDTRLYLGDRITLLGPEDEVLLVQEIVQQRPLER